MWNMAVIRQRVWALKGTAKLGRAMTLTLGQGVTDPLQARLYRTCNVTVRNLIALGQTVRAYVWRYAGKIVSVSSRL